MNMDKLWSYKFKRRKEKKKKRRLIKVTNLQFWGINWHAAHVPVVKRSIKLSSVTRYSMFPKMFTTSCEIQDMHTVLRIEMSMSPICLCMG
ncbi:hypothetical protein HanRHA438_Chr03g0133331 [Helianthus annuus]|nr:hypothetical protein HanRHA438_Chr03g0133331 [Helianthus annuus]